MQKKLLCPRCFEEFNESEVEYVCSNTSTVHPCRHAMDKKPQIAGDIKKPVCEECGQPLITKICPCCKGELPLNIGTAKSYPISIIGAKETGKSNYIAVLINELKNDIGRSYDCSLMACGDRTMQRYQTEFFEPLYRRHVCVAGTDAGEVEPLIYSLIFKKKGNFLHKKSNEAVSLTFFDTAGENMSSMNSMLTFNRYLSHSSGIILLLDPLQLPRVRDKLEGKIRLPQENTDINTILNRTVEIIRTSSGQTNMSRKIDIPIAISFTKIDAVMDMLDPSSCLKNDSKHVSEKAFDKVDFEDANNEMQSLVREWLGDELILMVSTQFTTYGFFGLSALGSNPLMDNKIPKFRPFRVSDPFLWLLALKKIIPTV